MTGLAGLALMALLLPLTWRGVGGRWALMGLLPAMAALAWGSTDWRAARQLADQLNPALEGQDVLVTGVVAGLPQNGPSGVRFVFEVESATWRGEAVALPAQLALGWYAGFEDEAFGDDARNEVRAGQRWQMPLRLKRPHGSANPDGFDVELLWFEQGMGATGQVRVARGGPPARQLADAVAHPVERLRQRLRDAIYREVKDPRVAGVLAALVVGDQAAIEHTDWDLFRITGIAHLVSISGVHVTMFAWLAGALVLRIWRCSPALMLAWPAPLAGRWLGLAMAAAYAMLAGWGVPAQRTVIMLAATVALRQWGGRWPWLLILLAAAVVVTVIDPWALLQAGFWLSFAAVALLMVSEPAHGRLPAQPGWRGWVGGHLRAQAIASLGLAPLSLVIFQQISIVGLVANLVAIPWVTLVITPLAMLGTLVPGLWVLAAWAVQAMVVVLQAMSHWPMAVWTAAVAPGWMVAAGLLGALLGVLPVPWSLRALAPLLVLPLLWPAPDRPRPGSMQVLAADVGQGTAVLVRTADHLLVYDTGPQIGRDNDAGQRVLLPLLQARGERQIDLLMLSHRDLDHVGGAASLLAALPVAALSSSLEPGHPLLAKGPPTTRCQAGQGWSWDGVRFDVLHPTPADYEWARKPNDVSCVLRIVDGQGRSVLLTGDIEAPQEAALLRRLGSQLASQVLLVPHHGSRTSSTPAFVAAVQPQWAVVQAAYRSRFGHPAPDVVARYQDFGINVVRSDQCGAWVWHDGAAACTRDVRRRYWHWTPPVAGADVAKVNRPGAHSR